MSSSNKPPKKKKQQLKNSDIVAPGGNYGYGYSGVVASFNTAISKYVNYTNAKTVAALANNQKEIVETKTVKNLTSSYEKTIKNLSSNYKEVIKNLSDNQTKVVTGLSRNHTDIIKTMNNNKVKKSKDMHDVYGKDDLIKMLAISNINVMNKLLDHVTSTSKAKNTSRDNMVNQLLDYLMNSNNNKSKKNDLDKFKKTLKLLNKEQTQ
ncbi:369_t:CDS:2, partial [Dentiscutata heterogama]